MHVSIVNVARAPAKLEVGSRMTSTGIVEFGELYYARAPTREQIERALAAPICERGRREQEAQLATLLRSP